MWFDTPAHMTTRRRFFPTAKVQHVPGQTVELEMQLRPVASEADPAAISGATAQWGCTGWMCDSLLVAEPEGLMVSALPGGDTLIEGGELEGVLDYRALRYSLWKGTPAAFDYLGNARPWPGPEFLCTELQIDTTYFYEWPGHVFTAALTGDAQWVVAWDNPFIEDPEYSSESYHRAHVLGSVLRVVTNPTDGSISLTETLSAKAVSISTGEVLLEMTFEARRVGF